MFDFWKFLAKKLASKKRKRKSGLKLVKTPKEHHAKARKRAKDAW